MIRSSLTVFVLTVLLLSGACTTDNDFLRPGDPTILDELEPVDTLRARNDPYLYGTVTFTWYDPVPNSYGVRVLDYHIAMNRSGDPVTAENWDDAEILGVYPRNSYRTYRFMLQQGDGIPLGRRVSFAVRPRYEQGVWGPVGDSIEMIPTRAHARAGVVVDEAGTPLEGVVVRLKGFEEFDDPRGFRAEAVTGADGRFAALGPLSEDAWFDYRTPPVKFDPELAAVTLTLIPRYDFDPAADGSSDWATTELLQVLSRTNEMVLGDVVNSTYRRWESFPVPVYIPPGLSNDGNIDLQAEVRDGMAYWNTVLGKAVFVETFDPGGEGITCAYDEEELGSLYSGKMEFVPQAPGEDWGLAIPHRALLLLHPGYLRTPVFAQETIRHELAHALGCYGHTYDNYGMMYISGGDTEALDYEIRLIRTLTLLPNGLVMTGYEGAYPGRSNF